MLIALMSWALLQDPVPAMFGPEWHYVQTRGFVPVQKRGGQLMMWNWWSGNRQIQVRTERAADRTSQFGTLTVDCTNARVHWDVTDMAGPNSTGAIARSGGLPWQSMGEPPWTWVKEHICDHRPMADFKEIERWQVVAYDNEVITLIDRASYVSTDVRTITYMFVLRQPSTLAGPNLDQLVQTVDLNCATGIHRVVSSYGYLADQPVAGGPNTNPAGERMTPGSRGEKVSQIVCSDTFLQVASATPTYADRRSAREGALRSPLRRQRQPR